MKSDTKRKLIVVAAGLSIIVFALLSMRWLVGMKKDPPKAPPKEIIRYVKAEKVKYNNLTTEIIASGRVNSKAEVIVSAEVSGKILPGEISFKTGQSFKKGDLLVSIYDGEAELALKAKRSVFLNRLANVLPEFKINYKESYQTWLDYFQSVEIDSDLPELPKPKSLQEKVFLASYSVLSDYYSILSDESKFRKYKIYAPFDGAFTEVNMEVGAIANPGTKLASIINTKELELEVPVEVEEAKWLEKGTKVKVFNGDRSLQWRGEIKRKANDVDVTTQSISVFVHINSTNSKPVYKGQYLIAEFTGIKLFQVMEIPRNAVFNTDEVFIVQKGMLLKREINIEKVNENSLFFNGIAEGVDVVSEPLINAAENTKVEILGSDKANQTGSLEENKSESQSEAKTQS